MINAPLLLGAIAGDVIGSVYEWNNVRTMKFPLFCKSTDFTDDTVLTIAIADAILNDKNFADTLWDYGNNYPNRGYGGRFRQWLDSAEKLPYHSFGNGSAMRVSAVGFVGTTIAEVLEIAAQTAAPTHNHPEGIKGAQAIAAAIFLAREGATKKEIKKFITDTFQYELDFTIAQIRPHYQFDVTCQGSVPQAIMAFLESSDYENAIRLAISIGGDSDTIACMTGGIALAFYKAMPETIINQTLALLPDAFKTIILQFDEKYNKQG